MKAVKVSSRVIEIVSPHQRLVMEAIKFVILEGSNVVLGPDFDKDNLVFIWEMDLDNFQHIIKIANGLDETNPEIYMTKVICWPCKGTGAEATAKHHINRQLNNPEERSIMLATVPAHDVAEMLQGIVQRHLNYLQNHIEEMGYSRIGDVIRAGNYVLPN